MLPGNRRAFAEPRPPRRSPLPRPHPPLRRSTLRHHPSILLPGRKEGKAMDRATSFAFVATLFGLAAVATPDEPAAPAKPLAADTTIREIYVPFEALYVVLDNDKHRVFLTREEYEEMIKQAQAKPQKPAPH